MTQIQIYCSSSSPQDGVTALHIASYKGHTDIVRYLCLKKLDANAQDMVSDLHVLKQMLTVLLCQDGVTPLMFAAKQGNLTVTKTLVESGHADLNVEENVSRCCSYVLA